MALYRPQRPAHTFAREHPARIQSQVAAPCLTASCCTLPPVLESPTVVSAFTDPFKNTSASDILDANRSGYYLLLKLSAQRSWISDAHIREALESGFPHLALLQTSEDALRSVCSWISGTATRFVGNAPWPLDTWFDLRLGECSDRPGYSDLIIVADVRPIVYDFALDDLPIEIANAVYRTLRLISGSFSVMLPEDLKDFGYYHEEFGEWFKALEQVQLTHDPEAALEFTRNFLPDICDIFGPEDALHMESFLEKMHELTREPPEWHKAPLKDTAEAVLQTVGDWKAKHSDLASHPWAEFVQAAASAIRDIEQRGSALAPLKDASWFCPPDEGETCISEVQAISFGQQFVWDWAEDSTNGILQAGEEPVLRVHLSDETLPHVFHNLRAFATGHGLLALAVHTQKHIREGEAHAQPKGL